ncbi:hypothetical protein [Alteromonas flava]|uniref:hypothetical protein n=1 Tax=Alteromonas flava TaxID=2048003 RepID=UPI000F5FF25F|nr:hypothetical protein [Alteromonas flava]
METIDKVRLPDRVIEIKRELSKRENQVKATNKEIVSNSKRNNVPNILTKTDGKIVHFIIRVWCLILIYFPTSRLYEAYLYGTIYYRRYGDIAFFDDPLAFSLEVFQSVLFAGLLIFAFIKNPFSLFKNEEKA